jgi:mevalonate kinase
MLRSAQASAPGSLMLMGEHAVLHGYPAIIMSLPEKITVQISTHHQGDIQIFSSLGEFSISFKKLLENSYKNTHKHTHKNHEYVLKTLEFFFQTRINKNFQKSQKLQNLSDLSDLSDLSGLFGLSGLEIKITSDFASGVGLGSSTAVVVALLKALYQYEGALASVSSEELFSQALGIIRELQGVASGADIAASIYGGCLFYQQGKAEKLPFTPQIKWQFSGKKVPTQQVIAQVNLLDLDYREGIYEKINQTVLDAKQEILNENPHGFAENLIKNQKLMEALFLDTPNLKKARQDLEKDPKILATKISGAGLGDGVIGLLGLCKNS